MLLNRFFRNNTLTNKDVDETLQWLHILLGQKIVIHGDGHEVNKTAVQLQVSTQMPVWVLVVVVVKVSVASEHLLDDTPCVVVKVLVKARCFANPVVPTRQL